MNWYHKHIIFYLITTNWGCLWDKQQCGQRRKWFIYSWFIKGTCLFILVIPMASLPSRVSNYLSDFQISLHNEIIFCSGFRGHSKNNKSSKVNKNFGPHDIHQTSADDQFSVHLQLGLFQGWDSFEVNLLSTNYQFSENWISVERYSQSGVPLHVCNNRNR